jgi:hypothetical protein
MAHAVEDMERVLVLRELPQTVSVFGVTGEAGRNAKK